MKKTLTMESKKIARHQPEKKRVLTRSLFGNSQTHDIFTREKKEKPNPRFLRHVHTDSQKKMIERNSENNFVANITLFHHFYEQAFRVEIIISFVYDKPEEKSIEKLSV